jgi:7-cyano-7-deazaguanine tRNA-ribosyltransferase
MLTRLRLGKNVLIDFDGGGVEGFDDILAFKPPFGPFPKELKETFPVGQSEIPEWDEAMVRQGCKGIVSLSDSHPESIIFVRCSDRWKALVLQEIGRCGVIA